MHDWLARLIELQDAGTPHVLVTVTGVSGSAPREVGAKMIVCEERFFGTIGGGHLEALALADARAALTSGTSRSVDYPLGAKAGQCCGGVVRLFFEVLGNGPTLYVFGAGHVGQAVARTLCGTRFSVHLIDERAEWVNASSVPASVRRHAIPWDVFMREARFDALRTHVVVMTHGHDLDQAIVEALLRAEARYPLRYLGLIGSRAKWARFRQRLRARGLDEAQLERVRCPIGLPLGGGKAPQEVAVSLAAELLGLLASLGAAPARASDAQTSDAPAA